MKPKQLLLTGILSVSTLAAPAGAQTLSNATFVNGIAIPGSTLDLSVGTAVDRRVGFFSDIYYDPNRNEWWGLSDRGPGGGTISYETRVQRFTIDIQPTTGAVSNFQIAETIKFTNGGNAMNGLAPTPANVLGNSFDPEGFVINPANGNLLVSDEYGPSLYEFDRTGTLVRQFTTPANLLPKVGVNLNYNALAPNGSSPQLTSGRESNRGMEGLAISPDGRYAYGILQNGTIQDGYNPTSATRGVYTRIVKYDMVTGQAVGQYAYQLDSSAQGRGISSIIALGNDKFLVLERNNRGVGIGATLNTADKRVYQIDLTVATDVTNTSLPATGSFVGAVTKNPSIAIDLDANTLLALGNKSPEKWEGLAIGPQLANGKYFLLAGTDNDYSVTQNGSGTQFDVYLRFTDADPYATRVEVPIGTAGPVGYELLPGVLHSYTANITGYVAPVPEPSTALFGLSILGLAVGRRRRRA